MIGKSSVDRCHVFDKLGVVPLSTKPLHAQERMASEADLRGGIVRHNEIGHGDNTQGIVPPPAKHVKTGRTQGREVRLNSLPLSQFLPPSSPAVSGLPQLIKVSAGD
jgi:hypothetical protein